MKPIQRKARRVELTSLFLSKHEFLLFEVTFHSARRLRTIYVSKCDRPVQKSWIECMGMYGNPTWDLSPLSLMMIAPNTTITQDVLTTSAKYAIFLVLRTSSTEIFFLNTSSGTSSVLKVIT